MVPRPIEGRQTPIAAMQVVGPPPSGGGNISLGRLIDFVLQRTYHELTVLAELLPRKTDMERKIEIVQFASRARQLFVRLLALVKWAASASKVEKCNDKIVPPDPITPSEKKSTLLRLDQIIQYRLVSSDLPSQMRSLRIENGRVTFHVEHEFEVSLTLMGDGPHIPWRLLDIDVLVEDKETGDGKSLVHSLQVHYIHQLIQSRLIDNPKPLHDLYSCLHSFCLSLQLEVLHSQVLRLKKERLEDFIRVEEYMAGSHLVVSYWREQIARENQEYKLCVQVDPIDSSKPLQVSHVPSLTGKDSILADQAIKSDHLSIEKLLIHTVHVRTKHRLADLRDEIKPKLGISECVISGSPAVLHIPLLQPCMQSEQLLVTVDTHTGFFLAHVPQFDPPFMDDIEEAFNKDLSKLESLISELRFWITMRRCEKTIQHLPAMASEQLSLNVPSDHPLVKFGTHKLFIKLCKHQNFYIVIHLKSKHNEIEQTYYLMTVQPQPLEDEAIDHKDDTALETELPKSYLKVVNFLQLDTFAITHGPCTKIDGFLFQLIKRGICHQGMQVEANGTNFVVKIVQMPPYDGCIESINALQSTLLSCTIRLQGKGTRAWLVEFVFCNCPLISQSVKEQGPRRPVYFMYDFAAGTAPQVEQMVKEMIQDWITMGYLYSVVLEFAEVLKHDQHNIYNSMMDIKSFTYKKLVLGYGQNKASTVSTFLYDVLHIIWIYLLKGSYFVSEILRIWIYCLDVQCRSEGLIAIRDGAYSVFDKGKAVEDFSSIQLLKAFLNKFVDDTASHLRRRSQSDDDNPLSPVPPLDSLDPFLSSSGQLKPGSPAQRGQEGGTTPVGAGGSAGGLRFHLPLTPPSGSNPHTPASPHTSVLSQSYGASPNPSFSLASPPSLGSQSQQPHVSPSPSMLHMQAPSPGNLFAANSPINPLHVPSPSFLPAPSPSSSSASQVPMQSPAASFMSSQGHDSGSPFPAPGGSTGNLSMSSPATGTWPGSPSMPRPSPRSLGTAQSPGSSSHPALHSPQAGSTIDHKPPGVSPATSATRVLPQRSWAAAIPTLLTHKAYDLLCSPSPLPNPSLPCGTMVDSRMSAYSPLERFLGCLFMRRNLHRVIQSDESLTSLTTTEPGVIQFKVETMQCRVSLNINTLQSLHLKLTPTAEYKDQWLGEELQILEKFFDNKVVCTPFKPNGFLAFSRILNAPVQILKNCINIMRLELFPDRSFKWSVQWCLTIPPSAPKLGPPGMSAVMIKDRMLFFLQLTRIGLNLPAGVEPQTLVVPIVYDMNSNTTQLADRRDPASLSPTAPISIIRNTLKRFSDYNPQPTECSIYPAIRELLTNLVIPI
ncbi:mediator of RNA polymerase II transcription subunit 14-like [Centruroides sculpturatus]|uniref:mediator of RNA polymerase II transcription subunit 14-like n=1 Tax=Centruroides sculpturatus TaxID=218467 RepID=UPI000C6E1BF5|nr:mediator of RNA polymerase II transcription subunit 14-like [Centruroides sculpturatus]